MKEQIKDYQAQAKHLNTKINRLQTDLNNVHSCIGKLEIKLTEIKLSK